MENNTPSSKKPQKIKFLITVMNRGQGEELAKFYRSQKITYSIIIPGHGAAGIEILDLLGLTETEKDMVITVVTEDQIPEIFAALRKEFSLDQPGKGIAFTVPVAGISGPKALDYVSGHLHDAFSRL